MRRPECDCTICTASGKDADADANSVAGEEPSGCGGVKCVATRARRIVLRDNVDSVPKDEEGVETVVDLAESNAVRERTFTLPTMREKHRDAIFLDGVLIDGNRCGTCTGTVEEDVNNRHKITFSYMIYFR